MKFNKIIAALGLGLVLMTIPSCHFLDIDTENKVATSEVDYTDISAMFSPVVGVYQQLRSSGMHWANEMLWDGRDDNMNSGRPDDQGDALRFGYRGGYSNPNSFWAVNNAWVTMYEIIRNANSGLEALDQYAENIADKNSDDYKTYLSYVGEVKTIRAWAYYMMVTTFGDCVILKDNAQVDFTRSTRAHVIEYVLDDLDGVIPNMKAMRPNQMAHMGAYTKYTAEALAARFALLNNDYVKVEKYTQDIIDNGGFGLYADYWNLFKIPGKLCDESLMEVQVSDFGVADGDYVGIDQWFNFQGTSVIDVATNGSTVSIGGWTFMRHNPNFRQWALGRGETRRYYTSFLYSGEVIKDNDGNDTEYKVKPVAVAGKEYSCNGKAYLPYDQMTAGNTGWGRNNNVRLIRYAEVLLMNAEAKVGQGKSGDAEVNLVRDRAGMSPLTGATLDQILDERRIELCAEWGLRYSDLIRTGKAAEVLNNKDLCPRDFADGEWSEDKAYWPVPGTQITNLPELKNDPK